MDWDSANKHMLACYPMEGVGYFKDGIFYPVKNLSTEPGNFEIDNSILLLQPDCLVHSHDIALSGPHGDAREPSDIDLQGQINTGVEWAIIVTDGVECNPPVRWGNPATRPPLLDREFIHGIQDCLSLMQDAFYQRWGIRLPNKARKQDWWVNGEDLMSQFYEAFGFEKVPLEDIQRGDVLFYTVRSKVVNHLGMYEGDGKVLSHWGGRVSNIEDYHVWARYVTFAARYKDK
jgi:proteasome lid subunit RPN8/RPN11